TGCPRKTSARGFLPCCFRLAGSNRGRECISAEPASGPTRSTLPRAYSTRRSKRRTSLLWTCFAPCFRPANPEGAESCASLILSESYCVRQARFVYVSNRLRALYATEVETWGAVIGSAGIPIH